jgi:hypothetical protein
MILAHSELRRLISSLDAALAITGSVAQSRAL